MRESEKAVKERRNVRGAGQRNHSTGARKEMRLVSKEAKKAKKEKAKKRI